LMMMMTMLTMRLMLLLMLGRLGAVLLALAAPARPRGQGGEGGQGRGAVVGEVVAARRKMVWRRRCRAMVVDVGHVVGVAQREFCP
jgi:hypothetical protein